jgi:putative ABC transport system permease protein
MLRNYFKLAWRHLQKHKVYSIINIGGLGIGIASCLLIGLYIWDELSFDRFHKNSDRIARVTWEYNFDNTENQTALTGTKVGPQFARSFPEVETYVRTLKYPRVVGQDTKMFDEKNFFYADSAFFSVFSFPLKTGDIKTALDGPNKIVLTSAMAEKYFPNENPIGKTLKVGSTQDFLVTGITSNPPENSQIRFDFVASFSSLNASKTEKWNEANYITYLLLKKNNEFKTLQSKIDRFTKEIGLNEMKLQGSQYMTYHLEPIASVHLNSALDGFEPNNSMVYIYVLAGMAFLILLIAGVNYANLSTAQSASRIPETGIRKVLGAGKAQVFRQFMTESAVLVLVAVLVSIGLCWIALPYFNELSGKTLSIRMLSTPTALVMIICLAALLAFVAGSYPATSLSKSRAILLLKKGFMFRSSGSLRKALIVLQFVVSIFLIIATIFITQQLAYIRNKNLGYNKEQVLVLPVDRIISEHYDEIKNAIGLVPGVVSLGGAYEEPTHIDWSDGISTPDGKQISVNALPVDEHAVRTLGIQILAGTDFTEADAAAPDTTDNYKNFRYSFMLNESAAKALGWSADEAVGKIIQKGFPGTVRAVVKDFHFRSLHEKINPLVIFLNKDQVQELFVRVSASNVQATLTSISAIWKDRVSHRPFEYKFLDEDYAALYKTETRTGKVFAAFSTLAILLACLGLFALTAFVMVKRTKEIGMRKILGASTMNVLTLVSLDFLKLVTLGLVISIPIAFYMVNKWLETFSYRIEIHWWVFAFAGLLTIVIAFVTISLQALKTVVANPVKNLRTE